MGKSLFRVSSTALLLLAALTIGRAEAQVIEAGTPIVVDGNGQAVGPVIDFSTNQSGTEFVNASTFVNGEPYFVRLFADLTSLLFQPGAQFLVAFPNASCSGPAFLVSGSLAFTDFAVVNEPGLTLWRRIPGSVPQAQNLTHVLGTKGGVCIAVQTPFTEGIPAEPIATGFVPPYSIEMSATPLGALDVPAVSPAGLVALALLLAAAGYLVLRKAV